MQNNEFLLMDIRSSVGSKLDLMITNTIGVVDSDYYSNEDNDGNIQIGLRNLKPSMKINRYIAVQDIGGDTYKMPLVEDLTEMNTVKISKGERVCQGIFVKYQPSFNCNTDVERTSGTGSTGKK